MSDRPTILIVAGPTASGKSSFAERLAGDSALMQKTLGRAQKGEIINADSVQMFAKLAIGTAKPDWRNAAHPHHLFDICDQPVDFNISEYRKRIQTVVSQVVARGNVPILVGGSLFYIKSLFYPPHEVSLALPTSREAPFTDLSNDDLWSKLNDIDDERAAQIHANDRYRVERALLLWQHHGIKPSELKPKYQPLFNAHLLFLSPPLETLYERINARTIVMIEKMGWIDEAREACSDENWRDFILMKKFIGYPELFAWIADDEPADQVPSVIAKIQQETRRYAKRQRTFWRSFCEQLDRDATDEFFCRVKKLDLSKS